MKSFSLTASVTLFRLKTATSLRAITIIDYGFTVPGEGQALNVVLRCDSGALTGRFAPTCHRLEAVA